MPKFDFYPSFNAGEVSPFIDARTSLEKYRSACRTLENFQILPYGGVIRRPGTQFLGTTKFVTAGEVRLIGFNFSTTTRFIIEMGVGYMRFWNPATGALQTNTSGGTLEVTHPYVGADLREIQYVQINDIMYFAHANYPPRKLSRLADNNWTFAEVDWEFPPQLERNETTTKITASNYSGSITLTASSSIFNSGHVGTRWALNYERLSASNELTINDPLVGESLDTIGAWDFTTFGKWDATIRILRIPNETWVKGPILVSAVRSGTTLTITHNSHNYSTGDYVHLPALFGPWSPKLAYAISVVNSNSYTITVPNSGATNFLSIQIENLSQMEIVREYNAKADRNIVTSGNEAARCGVKIWISSYNPPVKNGQEAVFSLLPSGSGINGTTTYSIANVSDNTFQITTTAGGAVSVANSSITPGVTTVLISSGVVSTPMLTITSLVNGVFTYEKDTTPRSVLTNSTYTTGGIVKINSVSSGTAATATVVEWLGFNAANNATTQWVAPAFSGDQGYPRAVALHEQRLCFGGTSKQPTTLWLSEIDNFEKFQLGTTAASAASFTLASSEGNRINWLYSQSKLLVGTSGDEWTIGSADTAQALSATNVEARKQSSYGSKYMRASLVNDVLLFVQRNGRKVRELVYEFNKDGWVAPDLTLLAEHITNGEIVDIAYQQQPDAVLWCVRGDGTLIAMTYERDQKVVGWHRHTIADNADVESVATIYGNGTEDEVWMVVKRTVSGQDYRAIERFPLLWRTQFDNQSSANYRYLDGHVAFASGAANRTVSGLAHLNGKTVTVMQDGQAPITRTVASGAITVPAAAAGYLGLPYTSTLRPMKLDADFEDGTAQSRKKRIHQVVVRTLKSRGGEVRTNSGSWYALAPTTTTGDQKIILGGAFGIDADVDVRQTEPYPMCIISILPKWDAYGNE